MATVNISQCCFETAAVVVLLKKEVKDLPVKIALFPFCSCLVNFFILSHQAFQKFSSPTRYFFVNLIPSMIEGSETTC